MREGDSPCRHGLDVSVTRFSAAGGTFRAAASCERVRHALTSMFRMAMASEGEDGSAGVKRQAWRGRGGQQDGRHGGGGAMTVSIKYVAYDSTLK